MYFITSSHCKGYDIIHSCWRFFRKAVVPPRAPSPPAAHGVHDEPPRAEQLRDAAAQRRPQRR